MKRFLIAGNWKMNKTTAQAVHYVHELKAQKLTNPESVAIIAPFTQLEALKKELEGTGISLGAQNVHYEHSGAFTGEISVDMLKEIGVDYCVVGHSERREYFNETDETVNRKLKVLLEEGFFASESPWKFGRRSRSRHSYADRWVQHLPEFRRSMRRRWLSLMSQSGPLAPDAPRHRSRQKRCVHSFAE